MAEANGFASMLQKIDISCSGLPKSNGDKPPYFRYRSDDEIWGGVNRGNTDYFMDVFRGGDVIFDLLEPISYTPPKRALIFGISGQDGPYLARLLLDKGYEVIGVVRRISHPNLDFIEEFGLQAVTLVEGDLSDSTSVNEVIKEHRPDEVYNLAAQSHVATSFKQPELTADVTGVGVLRILEAIRMHSPSTRFCTMSSSEMWGLVSGSAAQNEDTPFVPQSPYAAAKIFAHNMVRVYREAYGIHACAAICCNHEGSRRGLRFVTKKITDYVGRLVNGRVHEPLELGFLDSRRDWSFAGDIMEGIYSLTQHDRPMDLVFASGETHSVREFAQLAFAAAGFTINWRGQGIDEMGVIVLNNGTAREEMTVIKINPEFYRPAEVPFLLGDYSKAKSELGWSPRTSFQTLVEDMVAYDVAHYKRMA